MAEVKDGPIVNSNESNFGTSIKELWRAVHVDANKKRIADAASEIKNAATSAATGGINVATAYVEGKNADIGQVTKPLTRVAEVFKGPESEAPSDKTAESPIADKPAEKPPGEEAKPAEGAKPPAEPAPASGEDHGWMAKLMFKFLPSGVKDWAATAAIPMVTQGQSILQNSKTKPVVKDGISSYAESLMGGEISVIPKAVKDYAELLLDAIGMDKNDEMATALSVGFISFLREQLDNFFPGLGIKKGFNGASNDTVAAPSPMELLGFATNPKTFLGLFKLAPGGSDVDEGLFKVFKAEFAKKHNVGNIESFFPRAEDGQAQDKITYGQFVQSYAELGSQMLRDKKWNRSVDSKLAEAANDVLKKYNVTDTDGSLAIGLAAASVHGAELVASMTKPAAEPASTEKPAAPAPAAGMKP